MSEEQNVDIFNVMVAMYGEDCEYYVGISIDEATDNGRYALVKSKLMYLSCSFDKSFIH